MCPPPDDAPTAQIAWPDGSYGGFLNGVGLGRLAPEPAGSGLRNAPTCLKNTDPPIMCSLAEHPGASAAGLARSADLHEATTNRPCARRLPPGGTSDGPGTAAPSDAWFSRERRPGRRQIRRQG